MISRILVRSLVNPARAGMILFAMVARQAAISKPRASGDDPVGEAQYKEKGA